MTSPVVEQVVESSTNNAGTSHVINLPTATAGQLLLIILDKGSTAATINAHASLPHELLDENSANGLYAACRQMDGTEGSTLTLTSSANTRSAAMAYRISGAANPAQQLPVLGSTGTGTSATPDPPASAAAGSTRDFLVLAFAGMAGEEADDDTWGNTPPTNYTPNPPRQKSCGTAGTNLGGLLIAAERAINITSGGTENPGTFGVDVSAAWRAQTILIYPGATIAPGGIASAEAFGSASVDLTIVGVGAIASAEAFGTAELELEISGAGAIASAEAFGSGALDLTIVGVGAIASAEAFGSHVLAGGASAEPGVLSLVNAGAILTRAEAGALLERGNEGASLTKGIQ